MDQRCHPGTRVAILEDLCQWLLDDYERSAPSIYWITGVAGSGKSTISRSLLDMAQRMRIAHSSFFFSRDHDDRKTCQKLMATIARDLVSYEDPKVIQCVHDAVEKKQDSGPFLDQVHHLLRQPLESASHRVLLIWDALDECMDTDERRLLCELITQLPQFPARLSVLITAGRKAISRVCDFVFSNAGKFATAILPSDQVAMTRRRRATLTPIPHIASTK